MSLHRVGVVVQRAGQQTPGIQGGRLVRRLSVLASQCDSLVDVPRGFVEGGLVHGQPGRPDQPADLRGCGSQAGVAGQRERLGEPPAALAEVAALGPEPPQRAGQAEHGHPVAPVPGPAEGGPQVVMLVVQPRQPGHGLRAGERGGRLLRQGQVVSGVPLPDRGGFRVRRQLLAAVLPDRLQHAHPGAAARNACLRRLRLPWPCLRWFCLRWPGRCWRRRPVPLEQAAGHERRQPVQNRTPAAVHRAHHLGRVQRAAAGEHAHPPEQRPFRLVQQLVAPGDGVAHGLLPAGQVMRPVGQHRQPAVQPGQQGRGGQEPGPGRGQLDGQRQSVQPPADPGHGRDGSGVQGQFRAGGAGTLHEQLCGWRAGQRFRRDGGLGHGQRGDRVLAAAPHVQGDPAGDQHEQLRAGLQQGEHAVPGGQEMLEIV